MNEEKTASSRMGVYNLLESIPHEIKLSIQILCLLTMISFLGMITHSSRFFSSSLYIFSNLLYQLRDKRDTEIQRWINLRNSKKANK